MCCEVQGVGTEKPEHNLEKCKDLLNYEMYKLRKDHLYNGTNKQKRKRACLSEDQVE